MASDTEAYEAVTTSIVDTRAVYRRLEQRAYAAHLAVKQHELRLERELAAAVDALEGAGSATHRASRLLLTAKRVEQRLAELRAAYDVHCALGNTLDGTDDELSHAFAVVAGDRGNETEKGSGDHEEAA